MTELVKRRSPASVEDGSSSDVFIVIYIYIYRYIEGDILSLFLLYITCLLRISNIPIE